MPALVNAKHELFAKGLASGKTADESYSQAGYTPNRGNATRLKLNESIFARVAELQALAAKKYTVTIESLITEAEDARIKAMEEKGGSAAAVAALTAKAKLAGLWIEKQQAENTNVHYGISDELPASDWEREHTTPH